MSDEIIVVVVVGVGDIDVVEMGWGVFDCVGNVLVEYMCCVRGYNLFVFVVVDECIWVVVGKVVDVGLCLVGVVVCDLLVFFVEFCLYVFLDNVYIIVDWLCILDVEIGLVVVLIVVGLGIINDLMKLVVKDVGWCYVVVGIVVFMDGYMGVGVFISDNGVKVMMQCVVL